MFKYKIIVSPGDQIENYLKKNGASISDSKINFSKKEKIVWCEVDPSIKEKFEKEVGAFFTLMSASRGK